MTKLKIAAIGAVLLAGAGLMNKAIADASFSLSGTVPEVTTADVIWENPSVALKVLSGGAAVFENLVAALKIYSNKATGFTISALSDDGNLNNAGAITVPYKVALFTSQNIATAGGAYLTFGAGADSAYTQPATPTEPIYTTGALVTPFDTSILANFPAGAVYLGMSIVGTDVDNLMADTYSDTLTISILGD